MKRYPGAVSAHIGGDPSKIKSFNEQFTRGINRSIVKGCTSATSEGHFDQDRGRNENVFLDQLLFEEIFFEIRFYPHN